MKNDQPRTRKGHYSYGNLDQLCRCGHRLGDHTAAAPRECLQAHVGATVTLCLRFRPARGRPPKAK